MSPFMYFRALSSSDPGEASSEAAFSLSALILARFSGEFLSVSISEEVFAIHDE